LYEVAECASEEEFFFDRTPTGVSHLLSFMRGEIDSFDDLNLSNEVNKYLRIQFSYFGVPFPSAPPSVSATSLPSAGQALSASNWNLDLLSVNGKVENNNFIKIKGGSGWNCSALGRMANPRRTTFEVTKRGGGYIMVGLLPASHFDSTSRNYEQGFTLCIQDGAFYSAVTFDWVATVNRGVPQGAIVDLFLDPHTRDISLSVNEKDYGIVASASSISEPLFAFAELNWEGTSVALKAQER
jgi:hypothetical protein